MHTTSLRFVDLACSLTVLIEAMDKLLVKAGKDTPEILLDKTTGVFQINGRSFPEDAQAVFETVISWLTEYKKNPLPSSDLIFNLEYFNTSSGRIFVQILELVKEIPGAKVTWIVADNDDDMLETVEQFASLANIDINLTTP